MPEFDQQVVAAFGIHCGVSGGRSSGEVLCNVRVVKSVPTWILS
ncbi:hypothetical protein [Rhodococcus sp. 1168]|nr:hypothetical protein [Rhodococcus sp. 1168]